MNDIIKNHRAFVANQIEKSFDSGISVPQQLDIEKAKWKVGDEKQYQGATWVVGGFNAKGVPLWRKKKDSGAAAGGSGSATPKAAPAVANKTPEAPKSTGNAFDFNSGSSDWEVTKKDWQTQYRNEKLGVGVHVDKFGWYVVQNNRGYLKRWKTKDEAVKSVQEAAADQASVKSAPAAQTSTPTTQTSAPAVSTPTPATQNAAPQTKSPADMTFDEAVAIGVPNLTQNEIDKIKKFSVPRLKRELSKGTLRNAAGWVEDNILHFENRLKEMLKMNVGDKYWASGKVLTAEDKAQEVQNISNKLATFKERKKVYQEVIKQKNDAKKKLLDSTGRDFTEDQVYNYLVDYTEDPDAVVNNTWHTYMGRIGNTSATIKVGNGKEKSLYDGTPNWRPIGMYRYSTMGWSGNRIEIKGVVQSWDDVKHALSSTDDMEILIWKHPKQ